MQVQYKRYPTVYILWKFNMYKYIISDMLKMLLSVLTENEDDNWTKQILAE